ncbi:MAG: hypothetical protein IJY79_07430 [Clostridia bacterium]|nr:hypothetical protein [Clostridia bacterium]
MKGAFKRRRGRQARYSSIESSGTASVSGVAARKNRKSQFLTLAKLNIEMWLSLVERCVRDTIPNGSGKTCRIAKTPYKQPLYRWHSI